MVRLMRAVVLESYGDVEVLQLKEIPDPVAGREEIVVDLAATAMNRADLLQRRGMYPGPPSEFEVPGLEFAGTVAEVGADVHAWSVGDEVMGIVAGGSYAEKLVINQRQVMAVPAGVGLPDAAAIPEVFLTAFDALVAQGGLTSGRWALIHGGGSGVGTAGIQIAKAVGARVIVTASAAKHAACVELGADEVVDYQNERFEERVAAATNGRGVDVVLDIIGGDYLVPNIKSLRTGGKILQVGVMGGGKVEVPLGLLMPKRASLIGTVLRSRPLEEKAALTQQFIHEMLPRFEDGTLRPVIDSRYSLGDIAAAHTYMETNANIGKILITMA